MLALALGLALAASNDSGPRTLRFVDEAGRPLAGVRVDCSGRECTTGADGVCAYAAPGWNQFVATRDGYASIDIDMREAARGTVHMRKAVPRTVHAIDGSGRPVSDVTLQLSGEPWLEDGMLIRGNADAQVLNAQGTAVFSDAAPGAVTITCNLFDEGLLGCTDSEPCQKPRHAAEPFACEPQKLDATQTSIELRLQKLDVLQAKLVDPSGKPVTSGNVFCGHINPDNDIHFMRRMQFADVDEHGEFRCGFYERGRIDVVTRVEGFSDRWIRGVTTNERHTFVLQPGEKGDAVP